MFDKNVDKNKSLFISCLPCSKDFITLIFVLEQYWEMTGFERVPANNSSKYPKYLVYLEGRGKKAAFRNRITLGFSYGRECQWSYLFIAKISFKSLMNFNMKNAKCSLVGGIALCKSISWELNGCGEILLQRTFVPWQREDRNEPAAHPGSISDQRYAGLP